MCVCVNWVKKRDTLGRCLYVCCFFRDYCCCYFGCSCCCCCFEVVFVVVVVVAHAKSHECILSPFSKRLLIIWHLFRVIWAWVVRYLPHLFSRFAIVRRQGCWLFLFWFYDLGFRFVDEIQIKRNKRKRYALYECRYTIRLVWLWIMQFGYNEYENDDDANDDDVDNDNDDNEDG